MAPRKPAPKPPAKKPVARKPAPKPVAKNPPVKVPDTRVSKPPGEGLSPTEGRLEGGDRDAYQALLSLFNSYGLHELAPDILRFIQNGYGQDTVSLLLQDTPAYKQRFVANEKRRQLGLPVLSPAEYVSTERSYRQIMSSAGLPVGFYDGLNDFQGFLEGDMSPTELKERVDTATDFVNNADQATKDLFSQWYTTGDLIAYALDPAKAKPLVEKRVKAAELAGSALKGGANISQAVAEQIGGSGLSSQQLRQGAQFVGSQSDALRNLSGIYGDDVTDDDMALSALTGDATATKKVNKLASKERATFSGTGSQGKGSLSRRDSGSI